MTLQEIEQQWQEAAGNAELQQEVWEDLGWRAHGWFQACRAAMANNDRLTIDGWLERPSAVQHACLQFDPTPEGAVARAHLRCAQAILRTPRSAPHAPDPEAVLQTLQAAGVDLTEPSVNWWRDLLYKLQTPDPESARPPLDVLRDDLKVGLVEVDGSQERGEVAQLTLELMAAGQGKLYPDIALAFVRRDVEYCAAEQAVCSYLRTAGVWPAAWDVRWKITRPDEAPLLTLAGGSSSAALGLGLAKLFAQQGAPPLFEHIKTLSLNRLLMTASCTAAGTLEPVTAVRAKLAALRASSEIRCVILAAAQREREAFVEDAARGFTILWASTLQDAVQQLADYVHHLPDPFRPLRPFQEEDARYFCGREEESARLYRKVEQSRYVFLEGPSGSGKSSLVFAGLLPQLRQAKDWAILHCRPADQAFDDLQQALFQQFPPPLNAASQSHTRLESVQATAHNRFVRALRHASTQPVMLIIDQFEALFDMSSATRESDRFLEALLRLVQSDLPCTVLVIFRTDVHNSVFVAGGRKAELYRQFREEQMIQGLPQMTGDQLLTTLKRQAAVAGFELESGLLENLVNDIKFESEAPEASRLPLLQVALSGLVQESKKGYTATLTHRDYRALGDVNAIVTRYADQVIDTIAQEAQRPPTEVMGYVKYIFLRLVRLEAHKASPRVATRRDFTSDHVSLLHQLQAAQLVIIHPRAAGQDPDEDTIEVAHSALIRHWKRLQTWIQEEQAFLTWRAPFTQALEHWKRHEQQEAYLLPAGQLPEAQAMSQAHQEELTVDEKAFLQQSVQYRRFFWRTVGYTIVFGMMWRELFYRLFGSFLQPLPPWEGTLSPEVWNGAMGASFGALFVLAALEGPARASRLRRLPQEIWLLATGLCWGLAVLVMISLAYNAESREKIGWVQSHVQYAFIITGLGWSTGLALGEALWKRLTTYRAGAEVPILWRFLSQVSLIGLMSMVPPFVLLRVLPHIPTAEILTRAWGECLGQGAIAASCLFFYYGFRWGLWDKLWAQLWPSRNPLHHAPTSVR